MLELDGSYLPARVNLAFLLQAEGHYKQAWDELTHVLEGEKSFAPALEARSIISLQMGTTFGALLDINNALKVSSCELHDHCTSHFKSFCTCRLTIYIFCH